MNNVCPECQFGSPGFELCAQRTIAGAKRQPEWQAREAGAAILPGVEREGG